MPCRLVAAGQGTAPNAENPPWMELRNWDTAFSGTPRCSLAVHCALVRSSDRSGSNGAGQALNYGTSQCMAPATAGSTMMKCSQRLDSPRFIILPCLAGSPPLVIASVDRVVLGFLSVCAFRDRGIGELHNKDAWLCQDSGFAELHPRVDC